MKGNLFNEIVSAMETGELQAYYQPQYNAKKGVIGGAEALVRWVKKDGTVIYPNEFIPELEASGQLSLVDWYIAEEACKTIKMLKDKAVRISVNFGREHADDDRFVEKLDSLVNHYGIEKEFLGVEITESDFSTDKKTVINWVHRVEDAGYMVSIDDFGAGMSSLSFVKDVPARVLKIDKSFLDDNCQTEKGRMTLESVFYFAHRLKLTTVVEGVETEEQLQFINTCDCDYIQGFIFSKPVSKKDFLSMCLEEAPVEVGSYDLLDNQAAFGQVRTLIDSVYKKFPLIIYANISKNSYHVMRKEHFEETLLPSTGRYDEGLSYVKKILTESNEAAIDEAFSRQNLLKAHKQGKKRVLRIIKHKNHKGEESQIAVEDYFIDNPSSDDVYIVCFVQHIDFEEGTYI